MPELLWAFRDAIKAYRDLFIKGKILHRDILQKNIITTDQEEADGSTGILIDLDLATAVKKDEINEKIEAQNITGTLKFMAIQVLELGLKSTERLLNQTFRHDLGVLLLRVS